MVICCFSTKGPTQEMVDDFWRMIWQHKCSVVVMLTNLYENNVVIYKKYIYKYFDYTTPITQLSFFWPILHLLKHDNVISNIQLSSKILMFWCIKSRLIKHFWS